MEPTALSLAKDGSSTPTPLLDQIQFAPFGGLLSWNWQMTSGPQATSRVYDTSGRLVRYRLGSFVRDLSYDAVDRIASYTHYDALQGATSAATALNQSFVYDELGRLINIVTGASWWSIGYDANGNRTSVTVSGNASSYTTSPSSNRLNAISNPARSFGYDNAGNTTSDSTSYTSTYDLAGRLTTLSKAGTTSSYTYDAQGRRVRKVASSGASSTVIFVYDQGGQLLGEYDSAGNALREYVWLGSTPVAMFTPDTTPSNPPLVYFIHADHIDTPRIVVDRSDNLRWRWMAEPFGTTAPETNPQSLGAFAQNLRFPGQYFDQESGLHYNYFRYYDPTRPGYTQSDPIGLAGGINTYGYVNASPIDTADPTGLATYIIFTTQGKPADGTNPWARPANYAKSEIKQWCGCQDSDIKQYDVNNVSQVNAALISNSDIARVIFIGHSGVRGIYVGNAVAPGTNISTLPGPNNVSPASINWSNLNSTALIELWGCNGGIGNPSIAQIIANASNRPVLGFTQVINFEDSGKPFVRWWRPGGYHSYTPRQK